MSFAGQFSVVPYLRINAVRHIPNPHRRLVVFGGLFGLGGLVAPSYAADWPNRPVRIVIPFSAGGTADVVARLLAEKLTAALAQPVMVEARPGANGIVASDIVAKATPDGHTLLLASAAHASNASLYPKLPYDTARDFSPVAQVVTPGPMVLGVNAAQSITDMRSLLQAARARPGKLTYASSGMGSTLHLAGEMLCQMAGVQMLHVPYKGAAPALNDLAGAQIDMMFNSALALAPLVKEGRVRLVAQTGLKRSSLLPPDLPTVAESGVPGFETTGWFGLFAPARTPADVTQRLNAEVQRAMATPELRSKLALLGSTDVASLSTDGFAAFVKAESLRYARVIQAANITLETPTN